MNSYQEFLAHKARIDPPTGIDDVDGLSSQLFDFQHDITKWALRRGRAAVFAGTGLGKTFIELSWAREVHQYTGKPVLIFAPLAVSIQIERESHKLGISTKIVKEQSECIGICISNYEKINHFDLTKFGGVVLDESSILKHYQGRYRTRLIEECQSVPFRLAATATPAPNDFMELGNHAEFLGIMSYTDMLATFFVHDGSETAKWRLRGHAEDVFWQWMSSWAVMLQNPRDLGYEGSRFDLPPIRHHQHIVSVDYEPCVEASLLFPVEAQTLSERITARRLSVSDRVDQAREITPTDKPFVWWCNLNDESRQLAQSIDGAVELTGSDSDKLKEKKLIDFSNGLIRVLVTKPSIAGFGMNWQHCADTGFVGLNDSYEQIYQAIRRFWRFGQNQPVNVHYIASELEGAVVSNLRRKESAAEHMIKKMIEHMADLSAQDVRGARREQMDYLPSEQMMLPQWMEQTA